MRIAVFGDVGGHLEPLLKGLETVGFNRKTYKLPVDLTVIQVGDLVHKGPHSNKVVQFVEKMRLVNPGQWIQLMGNHEAEYVGGPEFWDDPKLWVGTIKTIRKWYVSKFAQIAVGIKDLGSKIDEEYLVTHAGLSPRFYDGYCAKAPDLAGVVKSINFMPKDARFAAGAMLGGEPPGNGGPVWAHCVREVYIPWFIRGKMPFSQIHGHTTPFWWARNAWGHHVPPEMANLSYLDKEKNLSFTQVGTDKHKFVSTDPGWSGTSNSREIQYPFVIENGEVVL